MSPRQPRKDATANRERVLDAATELVRREGEKVPMADIARHAGVGVGTVYRHFATREELLGALVHRSFELALTNALAAADEPGSALEGVRAFLSATLRDRDRFQAMGYRNWFVASCQNGARVVIARGWRRGRPRPVEPTFVRVLPRTPR